MPILPASERNRLRQRSSQVSRLSRLPAFRPAAARLLSISAENPSAVRLFLDVFRADPGLATNLLRLANSPLFGFRRQIETIEHALTMLGVERVRALASTIALGAYVGDSTCSEAFQKVWAHSVATAQIAEAVAFSMGAEVPLLHTAALLHEIGRLGLLKAEGARYADVMSREYYSMEESILAEQMIFGCSHDDAGAFLSRSWNLPEVLSTCIRNHHPNPPASGEHRGLEHLVALSCQVAHVMGFGEVDCIDHRSLGLGDLLPENIRQNFPDAAWLQDRVGQTLMSLTGYNPKLADAGTVRKVS